MHTGRIRFNWTATHHFAAVDYLRRRPRRGLFFNTATLLIALLAGLALLDLLAGGLSPELIVQLPLFLGVVVTLGAISWAVFMSRAGRRLLFRRSSAIACTLEFDERAVTVAVGKSPLSYPWAKVRSIDEDDEYVFVLASSSACFAIPKSAFGSPLEAGHFAATMRRFLRSQPTARP